MQIRNIFIFCACIAFATASSSKATTTAYRLAQFDINDVHFGSQTAVLNYKLASVDDILAINEDSRVKGNRFVALAKIQELTEDIFVQLVDIQAVGGIIIIVPKDTQAVTSEERKQIHKIEQFLMSRSFTTSIYFIYDEKDVNSIFNEIIKNGSTDNARFSVSSSFKNTKKPLPNQQLHTIESILYGNAEHSENLPTIVISANYDSFAVAPSMTVGMTDNASGSVALLELARLFSRFSANTEKKGLYNIVFLLTNGGIYDNEGLRDYIMNKSTTFFDNVVFALSLDRLGVSKNLTLEISRPAKNEEVSRLFNTFETVSKQLNIPFNIHVESVNLQNEHRTFLHERFALRRIPAGTLTSITEEQKIEQGQAFMRGSYLDTQIDMDAYYDSIRLVAESLTKYMIHLDNIGTIFEGALSMNTEAVSTWMNIFTTTSRCTPFLTEESTIIKTMKNHLSTYTDTTNLISSSMKGQEVYSFYADHSGEIVLSKSQSPFIDIYILLGLIFCMIFFYCFVVYITRGMSDLREEYQQLKESILGKEKTN